MIYLAADHAGFESKERLKKFLSKKGIPVTDLGAMEFDTNDDYPTYALTLAEKVAQTPKSRGILLCGSGQGVCIAANKVPSIRAALAWDVLSAKSARGDDNANILCVPGRALTDRDREKIVIAWITEPFSNLSRHKRRIRQITQYEKTRK